MKKALKVIGVVLLVIIVAAAIFIATFQPPKYSDFGVFTSLRTQAQTYLTEYKARERPVTKYLKSLHKLELDAGYAKAHEEKTKELVKLFYENDMAVGFGKMIFKDQFKKYWLDGFWNVQVELQD